MNDENAVTKPPMTVLCVDDELDITHAMKRLLRKQNYNLLFASSGAKALELMQLNDVHMIISDMRMPAMSGAELLEKVAISYPNSYRILLTGYADIESTVSAINKGKIHKYIQKPWNNDELISSIEEGLQEVKLKNENIHLQMRIKKTIVALKS
jgi:response regulator RpfG family c-di-GMP phosphodiesterase